MRVLFVVNGILSARNMLRLAEKFSSSGHSCLFIIPKRLNKNTEETWTGDDGLRHRIAAQYDTAFFPKPRNSSLSTRGLLKSFLKAHAFDLAFRLLLSAAVSPVLQRVITHDNAQRHKIHSETARILFARLFARQQIRQGNTGIPVDAIVVGEPRNTNYITPFIVESGALKVNFFCIQYSEQVWSGATEYRRIMHKGEKGNYEYSSQNDISKLILRTFFGKNQIDDDGIVGNNKYLYYPISKISSMMLSGLSVGSPWIYGSLEACRNYVFSTSYVRDLAANGYPEECAVVVGDVAHDSFILSARRSEDTEKTASGGRKTRIIYAVPHYPEHNMRDWPSHLGEFDATLEMLSSIADTSTVLSLHPAAHAQRYRSIAESRGVEISNRPLSEIIVGCDIFICTYSTTIHWARILRKHLIVFNTIKLENCFPEVVSVKDDEVTSIEALKGRILEMQDKPIPRVSLADAPLASDKIVSSILEASAG